jgi:hypothetical protein
MACGLSVLLRALPKIEAPATLPPTSTMAGVTKAALHSVIALHSQLTMLRGTREEERLTEDESARIKLGPRGVPGGLDTAKMTPQQAKNIPKTGDFDGHTA